MPCDNWNGSRAEALRRSRASLDHLNFAIPRRSVRDQGTEQMMRDVSDFIDCPIESLFVGFGRLGEPAQLADELER
jgi:hypothetical protein